jgi:hypothetical protein
MPATMPQSNAIPGFLPSVHGLHFANRYPPGPTIRLGLIDPRWVGVGDAEAGLCGGMSWFVRERFENGQPIPAATAVPDNGSPLFRAIVRRQILSLDWLRGPLRFWLAAGSTSTRRKTRTLEVEWPRIRAAIDAGRLPMLGLVRHHSWNPFNLTKDHQVLAFAYDSTGPTGPHTLRLYDPNWPNRDDVSITLLSGGFMQSTGEPLFGVLRLS